MRTTTLLLICLFLISGCTDKAEQRKKDRSILIKTVAAVMQPVKLEYYYISSLQAAQELKIFNQEQGQIETIPFREGQTVKKGDVLVTINSELLQRELDKARAAKQLASLNVKRLTKLSSRKLASDDEIAQARTTLTQATAEVALLETRISRKRITSPYDGVISQRNHEVGEVVALNQHILTLLDTSSLKAVVEVSELAINQLSINQPIQLTIDALGKQIVNARISRIYPDIDSQTHQGKIEILLPDPPAGARPGQLIHVHLISKTSPRLVVPLHTVKRDNEGDYIFVIRDNTAYKVHVTVGIQSGNLIEITRGINPNDIIVSEGFFGLRHGKKVKTRSPEKKGKP